MTVELCHVVAGDIVYYYSCLCRIYYRRGSKKMLNPNDVIRVSIHMVKVLVQVECLTKGLGSEWSEIRTDIRVLTERVIVVSQLTYK